MERSTVAIYEKRADEWLARRSGRPRAERATALGSRALTGGPVVDLGCGPGRYTVDLGERVVALDAAEAMLRLTIEVAPRAARVRADLEALPFADRTLGGGWAAMSYLHVPKKRLPLALAQLHRALAPNAPLHIDFGHGDWEGVRDDGDFPGRFFSDWREPELRDVLVGAGFEVESMDRTEDGIFATATRGRSLPDTVAPGMRVLFCGLNPSVYAADRGVAYARPGNRFWPALIAAGLASRDRDPLYALSVHGVGMTDLAKRATRAAGELASDEYRSGFGRVERLCEWLRPQVVCFVGLEGWRAAVDPSAGVGWQDRRVGSTRAYVMPSTSGRNAHASMDEIVEHLRASVA